MAAVKYFQQNNVSLPIDMHIDAVQLVNRVMANFMNCASGFEGQEQLAQNVAATAFDFSEEILPTAAIFAMVRWKELAAANSMFNAAMEKPDDSMKPFSELIKIIDGDASTFRFSNPNL